MLQEFPQEKKASGGQPVTHDCESCCFFRLVEAKGRRRSLCILLGEKKTAAGMAGCHFIPGQWSQIDRILGLPSLDFFGNTGDPNLTKPGKDFSKNDGRKFATTDIFAIDDSIGFPINHTAKAERRFVRPGSREAPVAR